MTPYAPLSRLDHPIADSGERQCGMQGKQGARVHAMMPNMSEPSRENPALCPANA
jgi:hypothetical protein